jgi:hypothetical protein
MAWDFKVLDEYRTLVQRRALNTEPPPRFKAFFTKNGNQWTLNAFGDLLRTEYERDRLKRFGYGARLIRRWLPKDVQAQLEEKQIPRWENVWIGDQIPETVEHSRGHSQRLMEYAAELLEPQLVRKRDFLSADELYCLICCLWLHDIGHTGLTFRWPVRSAGESDSDVETFRRFLGVWGLKQSQLAGVPPDVEIPVALFPSLVRLFHNFISAQRICCGEYLPERERDAVALISMYDRREMPLRAGTWRQQDFGIVAPALGNLIPDDGIPFRSGALTRDRILFLCAVLRLLDGLDVQSDRVIDENYWRERRQRTREEVRYCGALLERLAGAVNGADAGPARGLQEARAGLDELVKQWEKLPDHLEGWDQADHVEESAKSIVTSKINPLIKEVLFPAGAVAQPQEPLVHAISLANRILFKMMQEAHFYKHSRVKLVYLTFQEAGYQVQMMFEEEVPPERKKSLAGDIWDEVQPIKQLLEQHGINVTGIFDGVSGERLMPQEEGRDPRG